MKQNIKNFNKYRYLIAELVRKDIKLKYRRSYLGILWTLLEPLLTMVVLSVVFSQLYGKSDRNFPIYILTGRLLYSYFANSTKAAMKSIRVNASMIKKVYVPKYMYPVSSVLAQYVTFIISLIVLVGMYLLSPIKPTLYIFLGIIPLLILFLMTIGVGLILATMAVFFRDLEYLWSIVLMIIMYCSAIFYEPQRVIKNGYEWILQINPLYSVIHNLRNTVLYGQMLDMKALLYSVGFSAVTIIIGMILFYKNQDKFILNI